MTCVLKDKVQISEGSSIEPQMPSPGDRGVCGQWSVFLHERDVAEGQAAGAALCLSALRQAGPECDVPPSASSVRSHVLSYLPWLVAKVEGKTQTFVLGGQQGVG